MAYDRERDVYFSYYTEKLPFQFHGTGDLFASLCVGGLMRGLSLAHALTLAVDVTLESIRKTVADPQHHWYGVHFEEAIPFLVQRLQALLEEQAAP